MTARPCPTNTPSVPAPFLTTKAFPIAQRSPIALCRRQLPIPLSPHPHLSPASTSHLRTNSNPPSSRQTLLPRHLSHLSKPRHLLHPTSKQRQRLRSPGIPRANRPVKRQKKRNLRRLTLRVRAHLDHSVTQWLLPAVLPVS